MSNITSQERFRTARGVFDEFTNRNLFELHSRSVFEELVSPLKVGKESNVFLAVRGKEKLIVKIYRVQNCDFLRMYGYIRQDPRYEFLKNKRRDIIFAWVQREYKNLMKAQQAGVACPKPLAVRSNVLVETLIGDEEAAATLKDAIPQEPEMFFSFVVEEMKKLFNAGIVHGDLSSFNILNHQEKPYLIDFSQATTLKASNFHELLKRDVKNVCQFFRKLGMKADVEEVLKEITTSK